MLLAPECCVAAEFSSPLKPLRWVPGTRCIRPLSSTARSGEPLDRLTSRTGAMICQQVRGWTSWTCETLAFPRLNLAWVVLDSKLGAGKGSISCVERPHLLNLTEPAPSPPGVIWQNFLSSYNYLTAIFLRLLIASAVPYLCFSLSTIINHYLRLP